MKIPLFDILLLRYFEVVERPEQRQQPVFDRSIEAELMAGVNHEDAMELEARRLRIDVANAGQKQGPHELTIRQPATKLLDHHFKTFFARRLFNEPDDALDFGPQLHNARINLAFLGDRRAEAAKNSQIARQPGQAGGGQSFYELSTFQHGSPRYLSWKS
jgi:hypothetical protein